MPRHRLSPDSVNPMRAAGKTCKSHRRGAYSGHGGEGYEGKAGGLGMPGGSWTAAGPVGGGGPGRPGWAGPVRRIGDPGAVSVSGGVGPADGAGRRGISGSGASGPAAGVQPSRSSGLSPGPYGQLSRGGPHRGPAVSPGRDLPAGGRPPAAVFQQLRPGVYPGGGGAGLLRQPPGRGAAVGGAYSGGAGHSPGPAPAGGGAAGTSRLCSGPSPPLSRL